MCINSIICIYVHLYSDYSLYSLSGSCKPISRFNLMIAILRFVFITDFNILIRLRDFSIYIRFQVFQYLEHICI